MPDLDERVQKVADEASMRVARFWYSEAQKIAEQVDDPSKRWAILVIALSQIGWPKDRPA